MYAGFLTIGYGYCPGGGWVCYRLHLSVYTIIIIVTNLNHLIKVDVLLLYQFTFATQELIMMTGFLPEQFLLAPLAVFCLKTLEYMRIILMKLSSDLHLLEC